MRTDTKFYAGKGEEEFAEIFRRYCPAGRIAVVCQDERDGDALARKLGGDYDVRVYRPETAREKGIDGARFVIGVGGSGVIPTVKKVAGEMRYAFYPAYFDYRFLYAFDGVFTLPEFTFLSDKVTKSDDFLLRLYVASFQLYAECAFELTYASALPYRDATLEAYRKTGEELLAGKMEKEAFFRECTRYLQSVCTEAFARKKRTLVTERVIQGYGLTQGERYAAIAFLVLMAKNFTKRRFRDILIPSEKTVLGLRHVQSDAFDGRFLPSDELLGTIRKKVGFLTELLPCRTDELLEALRSATGCDDPLFAIINDKGITETIAYERSQRPESVFV